MRSHIVRYEPPWDKVWMDILLEMIASFSVWLGDCKAASGLVITSVDCLRSMLDYANQYTGAQFWNPLALYVLEYNER